MKREGGGESEIVKIERGSVREREREKQREGKREGKRERERNRLIRGGRMYVHLIFIL